MAESTSVDKFIVGQSAATKELRRLVDILAPADSTVLIQGQTGSGKDVVARAIHALSGRKGPLISINCAAIPTELLESELFGHEKGAFTGAETDRKGRFELADEGTLFLDEIGDMNLSLQTKLLRAIENRTIQRVGGSKDIEVNFRLICATHQNLQAHVDEGKFRADLFFRINVFPVQVPSLAERSVDIPDLINSICASISKSQNSKPPLFDETALSELSRYNWPGNVRELRNVLERAIVLFPQKEITNKEVRENLLRLKVPDETEELEALWEETGNLNTIDLDGLISDKPPLPVPSSYQDWFSYFDTIDLRKHLQEVEIVLIEAALRKKEGQITGAAEALKLRRTTLIEKMKKLMIERPNAN